MSYCPLVPDRDLAIYEIRQRPDRRGFHLTGPVLPYPLWYQVVAHAVDYAQHLGRSSGGIIRIYDESGKLTGEQTIRAVSGSI